MREQRIIWTALPNGKTGTKHKLSVFVGPRLMTNEGLPTPHLSQFPDFVDWTATKVSFRVKYGAAAPVAATIVSPPRRADLWQLLFTPATYVEPFQFDPIHNYKLRSYPIANVRDFVVNLYLTLAATSATEYPTSDTLLGKYERILPPIGTGNGGEAELIAEIDKMFDPRVHAIAPTAANPPTDFEQAKLFLAPHSTLPKRTTNATLATPKKPSIDFHRMVTLLGDHPHLLRLFGLAFDLEVTPPAGLGAVYEVTVIPSWTPKLTHPPNPTRTSVDVLPQTMTEGATFSAGPNPATPEVFAGLLDLADPSYQAVEFDVDGAAVKSLDFADALFNALSFRTANSPTSYSVPSLRSGGLGLAKTGQAYAFGTALQAANIANGAAEASPPAPITFYSEDLARGFRIDVWDNVHQKWRQLCGRTAAPKPPGLGGYGIGTGPTIVPVPAGDEGWVQLSTTSSADGSSTDQYLTELILKWRSWSLVAPRPGKHLGEGPADGLAADQGNPATGDFKLSISYAAAAGTLPTLRFGRTYRFRARAADLAGNGVPFSPAAPPSSFLRASPPVFYGRLEPVASPVLVPVAPKTAGEHLQNLVIRSNYNVPDSSPTIVPCGRFVAPPSSAEEMAEAHAVLDSPAGRPDPAKYALVSSRANVTYASPAVTAADGGKNDATGWQGPYYPVKTLPVPYLPDVPALGATFLGLPGGPATPLRIPFYEGGAAWPQASTFMLEVKPGSGSPVLPSAANDWTLTVFAPKASITTVPVSCYINAAGLRQMQLYGWLAEAGLASATLVKLMLAGQHWMFTPFREMTIVHAVRQPLTAPRFTKPFISRGVGATYALLSDTIEVNRQSSVKLDILSSWQEPFDDGVTPGSVNPAGFVLLKGNARVGEIPLDIGDPTPTTVAVPDLREDFGDTKHRQVYYEAVATSRFLEYFAETTTVTLNGTTPATIHAGGLAPGATVVTDPTTGVTYQVGVDYSLGDTGGEIARLATGSIPNHHKVSVRFVPQPVTRTSVEAPIAAPNTKNGRPLNVPSSAPPASPDLRYILPLFSFSSGKTATGSPTATRTGNALRIYLGRPWWSSGDGELLGVVVWPFLPGISGGGIPPQLEPFVTRYGSDPLFVTNAVSSFPAAADYPLAKITGLGIVLQEMAGFATPPRVSVAGHAVSFDPVRNLWYTDVEIDAGNSYWPMVRLALVRYQPSSLPGVEVSRVVQANVAQLAPGRVATFTFPTPAGGGAASAAAITVVGAGYSSSASFEGASEMRAFVELERPGVTDPDLKWMPQTSGDEGTVLNGEQQDDGTVLWYGTIALPFPQGSRPMRIRLQEAELYSFATASTLDETERITYLDALQISELAHTESHPAVAMLGGVASGQIAVRLPDDLMRELDALVAGGAYESRAAAVRAGIEVIAAIERRRRDDRVIVDGYRRIPPTSAELDAAVGSLREAIAEEPW